MQKYWFKNKRFGIGLEPATWEGWLITAGFLVFVVAIVVYGLSGALNETDIIKRVVVPILSLTFLYMTITIRTGEKIIWKFWKKNNGK